MYLLLLTCWVHGSHVSARTQCLRTILSNLNSSLSAEEIPYIIFQPKAHCLYVASESMGSFSSGEPCGDDAGTDPKT